MSKQSLNTLKSWFVTKAKPLAVQFWHWMDSYWHKDELIPAASIDGLQTLLDGKMDVKAGVDPEQVGVYDPDKNYVFDALVAEYVSFSNPGSADPQFQTEKFYRLKENAPAGENPETHPAHWAFQGTVIGEITIDDVVGLQEALDNKVDKVTGKGLSTEDYTTAEKTKLASLNVHNRGTYTSLAALQTAIPVGNAGDEAIIDAGIGTDAQKAVWDTSDNAWVIAGGGTIAVDAVPTEGSNNAVSSDGVFQGLAGKANKPATQAENKLWYTGADGTPVETPFTYDQIFQFGDMDVSAWLEGEQRLVLVTKSGGLPALQNAAELRDIFAPPGVDAQLLDNTNWVDEAKTLTGENFRGELGNPGQVRILQYGTYCWCESSTKGTDGGANGTSTWKRNRAVDVLDPNNNTQDSNVCDQLNPMRTGGNTDDGWDLVNNTKVLTIPARWGTWWKDTAGYMYFCYGVNGTSSYWWRNGTPQAIQAPINTTSHPTLTTNLLAHDFTNNGVYTDQAGDETSYWDQYFYDAATRAYFKKISGTQWEKIR